MLDVALINISVNKSVQQKIVKKYLHFFGLWKKVVVLVVAAGLLTNPLTRIHSVSGLFCSFLMKVRLSLVNII